VAQKKGIRLVKPSDDVVRAYIEKAQNALKSMDVNANAGITEWAISAAYYARYFSVYALLSRIGVKCEIHDCTVALFEYLFGATVSKEMVEDLRLSKQDRVEYQYYPKESKIDLGMVAKDAKVFVLEIEKLLDESNQETISALQKKLKQI
jgi:uncharacterized protein (UPF0332 family)